MQYTIRRLGPDDVALARALNGVFAAAFDEVETYAGAPPADAWLSALLGREHVVVLVALAGMEVIGGLVAYELDKLERARREVYVYDLAVAAAHRRHGVATALLAEAGRLAAARGAWAMFVQADYGDDAAIALYGRLGQREAVLHFDLPVG